jgi:DNA-binding LacI/PurR family transcriptional regulator
MISEACDAAGYHAVPLAIGRQSLFDGSRIQSLGRVHVDGMIVLDYKPQNDGSDLQERLPGHPLVCRMLDATLDRPRFPSIAIDYFGGACTLLRHIAERGWRKFQFIVEVDPNRPHVRNQGRPLAAYHERAIAATSRSLDLPIDYERNMIRTPGRLAKARYDAMVEYLAHNRLEPGVCLVQDGADGISGTYSALVSNGYVIGRDVAVATFNATPPAEHVQPYPAFVAERSGEISRLLLDLAIDAIEGTQKFAGDARFNYSQELREGGAVPDVSGRSGP